MHIHLQEGFTGQPVRLRVNGTEVFSGSPKTRLQIGLAHQVECEVGDRGAAVVEIELPDERISETFRVEPSLNPYAGLSLDRQGKVQVKLSAEPFGYV